MLLQVTTPPYSNIIKKIYSLYTETDLKYENILFTNSSPKAEIKLIDFGLSSKFANEDLTEGVGTM